MECLHARNSVPFMGSLNPKPHGIVAVKASYVNRSNVENKLRI